MLDFENKNIKDIREIPHSPNTSLESVIVFNPLNKDFTHGWEGVDYTIPTETERSFPEFLAHHLAKHLAEFIAGRQWAERIEIEGREKSPNYDKAVPLASIEQFKEAILKGKNAFYSTGDVLEVRILTQTPEADMSVDVKETEKTLDEMLERKEKARRQTKKQLGKYPPAKLLFFLPLRT